MTTNKITLQELLNNIAKENGFEKYKIDIKELSSDGANYSSILYTVDIKEENNLRADLHLFAKVCVLGEHIRKEFPSSFLEVEFYCYTTLWKAFKKLEDECGLAEEQRLAFTKFYGGDPTLYQETIVLENLLAHGYQPFDRFHSIDWEYASSAVKELSKMHALSYAYRDKHPEEFQEVFEYIWSWSEGAMDAVEKGSAANALKHVNPENKEALARFLDKYMKDMMMSSYQPTAPHPVLVHGDYRGSNLMHHRREDGSVDIKIVDLQTLQGGSPVTDLLYFIFTGSDEKFRAEYYDKLIDHYYAELSAALKRLHLNPDEIYSRQHFDQELQEKLPFGLALAVFTLPVITVDTDKAPKVNESMEITDFSVSNTSALYKERLNGVINDYVRWGVLK